MAEPKYRLRFLFEHNDGGCLWAENDNAYNDFGFGPIDTRIAERFPVLATELLEEIFNTDKWYSKT